MLKQTFFDLNGPYLSFIEQPVGVTITNGESVTLVGIASASFKTGVSIDSPDAPDNPAVSSGSLTYQWYEVGVGGAADKVVVDDVNINGVISGAGTTALTIAQAISPQDDGKEYYVVANYTPSTILCSRQISPQTGVKITDKVIGSSSPYYGQSDADAQIYNYLWDNYFYFDFDGDGIVSPTDGAMFMRLVHGPAFDGKLLSGMSAGDVLPISANATRTGVDDEETEALIRTFYNNHRDNTTIDRGTYNGSAIGNKNVYDIDANDSVSFSGDGMMMARVFGYWQNGANAIPTDEILDPDDGGPAVWNGSTWELSTTTTGDAPNEPVSSGIATITIYSMLEITSQPTNQQSAASVDESESEFYVGARVSGGNIGDNITYQWYITEASNVYNIKTLYRFYDQTSYDHYCSDNGNPASGYYSQGGLCSLFTEQAPGTYYYYDCLFCVCGVDASC